MAVRTYQDLLVWQRGIELAVLTYRITESFPRHELYGLTNQIRRAAVSVPSNVAEGQGRGEGRAFTNHLLISQGSLQELETQAIIANRLGYIGDEQVRHLLHAADEVGRLNRGLLQSLATSN